MDKRGLSGIVAVILIILIVLVAISAIWVFVQPTITEILVRNFGDGDNKSGTLACLKFDLKAISCEYFGDGDYSVKVQRGEGEIELNEIKFKFGSKKKEVFVESITTNLPTEYGVKTYDFNINLPGIVGVDVAAILGGNACEFSGVPIKCQDSDIQIECEVDEDCSLGEVCIDGKCEVGRLGNSCDDSGITVIDLGDFNLDTCTRTRSGLVDSNLDKIPSAGLRVIGDDLVNAGNTGASFGRNIIHWYQMYRDDKPDELNFSAFDTAIEAHHDAGMKIILTLRSNHPDKSEVTFNPNGRTLDQPDSWPKYEYEAEWINYLETVVDRYYLNPAPEHEGVVVAIQVGNEWGHQFEVNEAYGRYTEDELDQAIVDLMKLSHDAVKRNAPNLPVISFAVSGTPKLALGAGFNEEGWIYDGRYYGFKDKMDNVSILKQGGTNNDETIARLEGIIANGADSYDYFDAHIYFQSLEGPRYVANFIRSVWRDNGIYDKGLISTEFATPTFNFSYGLHSYNIRATQSVAYHSGFDAITWGNWNPSPASPNLLQASLKENWASGYFDLQVANYTLFAKGTKDFGIVSRQGDLFSFDGNYGVNIELDVPYPSYYQCSDGLDNDNDGYFDEEDSDCLDVGCNGGVQDIGGGCIDPAGFSEDNWVHVY